MPASRSLPALALGVLLSWSAQADAQNKWFMIPGSHDLDGLDLLVHEDMVLMAGGNGRGVFRVRQDGTGYQVEREKLGPERVYNLASVGRTVYTAEYQGVRRSDDKGATWSPLVPVNGAYDVLAIAGNDSLLFAATERGVWVSRDRSATWTRCMGTLGPFPLGTFASLVLQGSHVFVGWDKTWIMHSPDLGKTWEDLPFPGQNPDKVLEILVLGNRLLVSGKAKLNISTDLGQTWLPTAGKDTLLNTDLPNSGLLSYSQGMVYAQRGEGPSLVTRVSADSGATWSQIYLGYGVRDVVAAGTNLFVAGNNNANGLHMISLTPGAVRTALPGRTHEAAINRPVFHGSGVVIPWMNGILLDPRGRRL